ncbi:beta(1,3)galactosyltransferase EpsH [Bacillus sp. NTK071]|uniref:PssE/Cps14G family polysaccharide biosynthesis glycosyltransferase n=1 Tax=Bacillus sp. NTK071 TaxID=2802175 RepID=UPI001A8D66F9|nr:PssE/Cps14G family polysaccharide biosynthesis glycosyltransferase [Bacillus sp. NTK071]MBN8210246.1 beta(1,3)galactosyltransferase EpsH [Bacillus sp. NTK071]
MIFVCVGSREYQFNRLLIKLDELIAEGSITDEVFAQIGQSSYIPKHYNYKRFMSVIEFKECQRNADLVVSHGGTGALIGALKMEKQLLAVPRLAKYNEHIDDHQTQVASLMEKEGYLRCVNNIEDLLDGIKSFESNPIIKTYNKPSRVINIINDFIDEKH